MQCDSSGRSGDCFATRKILTVNYIGKLKAEANLSELDVRQRIEHIGIFLAFNRQERMDLLFWGAVRLNMEEAKEVIAEQLYFGEHFMTSPRRRSDRNFRISAVRVRDPENPEARPGFKFFRRGDIRDTAGFFNQINFMGTVEENVYTIEGVEGTFREHPVEVAGTILEGILGLGAIYEHHGYEELTELPDIVTMLESGLMKQNMNHRSRIIRRKEWMWDE
eukprot:16428457-Heterocapsa_arctica.AAC.2